MTRFPNERRAQYLNRRKAVSMHLDSAARANLHKLLPSSIYLG